MYCNIFAIANILILRTISLVENVLYMSLGLLNVCFYSEDYNYNDEVKFNLINEFSGI
jgi:hypothetical protein